MFPGHSYDQAMDVSVPIRRWLIKRWNKQKQLENSGNKKPIDDLDEPLSQSEKKKYMKK